MARNGHQRPDRRPRAPSDAVMPHSTEAEEAVIGGVLVLPERFADVDPLLRADDFYHPALRAIYEALEGLDQLGRPIDTVTVLEAMRANETADKLRAYGGNDYLLNLVAKTPPMNIAYHARIVHSKARVRAVVAAAREIAAHGQGDYGDLDEFLAEAQQQIQIAAAGRLQQAAPATAAAVLRSEAFRAPRLTYPTCFAELNEKIAGGVKARQLTVIAAPTGSGKTGIASTMALDWARASTPVLWVHTEIDAEEQSARFAAIEYRQQDHVATPDDFLSLRLRPEDAAGAIEGLPIHLLDLDDHDGDPFSAIEARAVELRNRYGQMPIIVLDYLQVLAVEEEDQRRTSVTKVATRLRKMARKLNAAVVAISSVSRAYYGKAAAQKTEGSAEDPIHWLAAAKESGDIEYACGVFAYLDTSPDVDMLGEASARLIVAKSRRGVRGFVGLRFHGPSGLFRPAVDSMTTSAIPGGPTRNQQTDDKVLRFVNGPVYQPTTLRQLREMVPGVRAVAVDRSIERLLQAGLLAQVRVDGHDATGRKRSYYVIGPAPANQHQAPSTPNPTPQNPEVQL